MERSLLLAQSMKLLFGACALFCFVAACSVPNVEAAPLDQGDGAGDNPSTGKKKTTTSPGGTTPVDTTSDPKPSDTTTTTTTTTTPSTTTPMKWTGKLDSTNVVGFGGDGACNYQVVLTNVQVALELDAQGRTKTSKVTATMTETAPSCSFSPKGTLPLEYDYFPGDGGDVAIELTPSADNDPQGTLLLTSTTTGASAMHVTLAFHRTDQPQQKLDWTVTGQLDLKPAP